MKFEVVLEQFIQDEFDKCPIAERPVLYDLIEKLHEIKRLDAHYAQEQPYQQDRHERYITFLKAKAELFQTIYDLRYAA